MNARHRWIQIGFFLVSLLLSFGGIALAQSEATPIQIGENVFGELTTDVNVARYTVTAAGEETANIQVLALSEGFAPRLRLINPAGVEILMVPNPDGLNILTSSANFADAGDYLIEVQGENSTFGQFTLSLQPGASLPEAVELVIDQPIADVVSSQTPVRVYHFNSTVEPLLLTILTDETDAGVLLSLYNEDEGKTIATSDAGVSGVAYRFPPEEHGYRLEVRVGDDTGDAAYTICLGNCGNGLLSVETTAVPEAVCIVVSSAGAAVNVRSGPGTEYAVIGNLAAGESYPALGQLSGGEWYQVSVNGQIGWAAASVAQLDGDCANLAEVSAPANAQLAPTQPAPTQSAPTQPTGSIPSPAPSNTPQPTQELLPDLSITIDNVFLESDGDTLYVTITVSNIGDAPAESIYVGWYVDNYGIGSEMINYLGAGNTHTIQATASLTDSQIPPPAGLYYAVTAIADYYLGIFEITEENNYAGPVYLQ